MMTMTKDLDDTIEKEMDNKILIEWNYYEVNINVYDAWREDTMVFEPSTFDLKMLEFFTDKLLGLRGNKGEMK